MKTELEHVHPAEIERRSFSIISQELGPRTYAGPYDELILKRVIHASADFDYADHLVFSPGAVESAMEAIRAGADIVTDTQMAKAPVFPMATATKQTSSAPACFKRAASASTVLPVV